MRKYATILILAGILSTLAATGIFLFLRSNAPPLRIESTLITSESPGNIRITVSPTNTAEPNHAYQVEIWKGSELRMSSSLVWESAQLRTKQKMSAYFPATKQEIDSYPVTSLSIDVLTPKISKDFENYFQVKAIDGSKVTAIAPSKDKGIRSAFGVYPTPDWQLWLFVVFLILLTGGAGAAGTGTTIHIVVHISQ